MKKDVKISGITSIILISGLIFQSCVYSNGGFGPTVEEVRNVGSFNALRVSSGIDITLIQGEQTKLIVIADEDIIDDVESEVVGDELRLSVDRGWFRRGNVDAIITFVNLESLDVSAGSDVESEGLLRLEDIDIEASSGSDIKLSLEGNEVNLRTSSGSDASLTGSARGFFAKASSGSDINAYEFEVENAVLELSSGSDVKAWVTRSLEVNASSGSDVYYKGDPEVLNINTSSGSDVHKR